MDTELIENTGSQPQTENPHEDLQNESSQQDQEIGSRTITWTLTCSDAKVHPKAYQRLKSEIAWSEQDNDSYMMFKSTDMDEIDSFSKQLKAIFAENEDHNTVKAFLFTIRPN